MKAACVRRGRMFPGRTLPRREPGHDLNCAAPLIPVKWRMPDANRMSAVVAGVVLAAGASTRMGHNKLLLELEGMTLLRRAAVRAVEAGLTPVIVVLGHDAVQTRAELEGLPVSIEISVGYREGMGASLRTGIGALA